MGAANLRVLFVTPSGNLCCGERQFGEIWVDELRLAGVDVTVWDGFYPSIYEKPYLPADAASYDLIHVNWGPANLGHYLAPHFPKEVPLSVFMHDVPPNSTCLLMDRADLLMSFEEAEGSHVLEHAVPRNRSLRKPGDWIVVGTTGIRADAGVEIVKRICDNRGWIHSGSDGSKWLSLQDEIDRLASCTVNVCWYETSGRGKSMAAMFCVAAQRPLIVSGSTMFSALWPYVDEITIGAGHGAFWNEDYLMGLIDWAINEPQVSTRAAEELSWPKLALKIKELWGGVAR